MLSRCIYDLRRQLSLAGASDDLRALIETLPKRGYRLHAEVTPIGSPRRRGRPPCALETACGAGRSPPRSQSWASRFSPARVGLKPPVEIHRRAAFRRLERAHDQAYLADGFTEEILDRLNQSTDLRVIARTSSFALRGKDLNVAEIARKLHVTHVLEGSVRKSGDSVRVTAQLIATADSSHLWSSTFERQLGDLFAIQDEIAAAVASALRATLKLEEYCEANAEHRSLRPRETRRVFYYRRAPGDIERSVELFEQAVAIDPAYARAWARLAGAYSIQAWTVDPPSEVLEPSRETPRYGPSSSIRPGVAT